MTDIVLELAVSQVYLPKRAQVRIRFVGRLREARHPVLGIQHDGKHRSS
jgi:hypothetical protein